MSRRGAGAQQVHEMAARVKPNTRRFYISLPIDDPVALDKLTELSIGLTQRLWPPNEGGNDKPNQFTNFNRSKAHITLWACDLLVDEETLKERLATFITGHYERFTNLKIRFEKLSYLSKPGTRYIVASLDQVCRAEVDLLKRRLEGAFGDLGKSLLDRATCQIHCSIVACASLHVRVNLIDVLSEYRPVVASINEIQPNRLIVTSKWSVLACGAFQDGKVTFPQQLPPPPAPPQPQQPPSNNAEAGGDNVEAQLQLPPQPLPVIDDDFEEDEDFTYCTIDLINFPVMPNEDPKQLLLAVARLVNYNLEDWMVRSCIRDFSVVSERRASDIVAVLVDQDIRDEFLAAVKEYWKAHRFSVYATAIDRSLPNNKIAVVRRLTEEKRILLGKAKRFAHEHGFKHCMIDAENNVCLREDDQTPVYAVQSMEQLQRFIEQRRHIRQYPYVRRDRR